MPQKRHPKLLKYNHMDLHIAPDQFFTLLRLFPDSPENVHVRYFIIKNLCEIYLTGNISDPQAIVVRSKSLPSELFGYRDPNSLFEILQSLKNWNSLLVENNISQTLGHLLSKTKSFTYEKEIYLILKRSVTTVPTSNVRLLTVDDLSLVQKAHEQLYKAGVTSSYKDMLVNGIVTGIIIDNQLVSMAHAIHITEKFADVGIFTAPNYINKGYFTSAAALLIKELQTKGLTPVWSTDENNFSSLKVAHKLGFTQTYTKTYINIK